MLKTIQVTQEDIDTGEPGRCLYCPLAKAIRRVLTGEEVSVVTNYFNFGHSTYYLPKVAEKFRLDFDARRSVVPFTFEIDI